MSEAARSDRVGAPGLRRELGLGDLVLFNIAAVVGIRWLAAAARVGSGALGLWVLAAALFFVPCALAVSRMAARYPEQGGLYVWTLRSFGDWHGFLCGWCYWLSNLFYFPNLLLAGLSMGVYMLGPQFYELSENRAFMVGGSLALLWAGALTNLVGLRVGKWTENLGAVATYTAGFLLMGAGAAAWLSDDSRGIVGPVWPRWEWGTVNFWSQIAFAFGGLELSAVMSGEIRAPERTLPRAAWISGAAIAGFYICGTLAMLALLPPEQVSILSGLAQAGAEASRRLGAPWIGPLLAGLITAGITGQLGAWLAGAARVPFVMSLEGRLPPGFARLSSRWGTPHLSIILQAAACSVFLLAMQAGESLRAGYQLLVDMTVISYFIPFVYLFLAARREGVRASLAGLAVTLLAIAVSVVPPAEAQSPFLFEMKLAGGCALLVGAARMVFKGAGRA